MAYTPNPSWADGETGGTPITAATLNHIEAGIVAAAAAADAAASAASTAQTTASAAQTSAGLSAAVRAIVTSMLQPGANVTLSPSGSGGSAIVTVAATGGSSGTATIQYYPLLFEGIQVANSQVWASIFFGRATTLTTVKAVVTGTAPVGSNLVYEIRNGTAVQARITIPDGTAVGTVTTLSLTPSGGAAPNATTIPANSLLDIWAITVGTTTPASGVAFYFETDSSVSGVAAGAPTLPAPAAIYGSAHKALWKASDIAGPPASGATVNTWTDPVSTLAFTTIAGLTGPSFQPAQINGLPALRFTQSSHQAMKLINNLLTTSPEMTIHCVIKYASTGSVIVAGGPNPLAGDGFTQSGSFEAAIGSIPQIATGDSANATHTATAPGTSAWAHITFVRNATGTQAFTGAVSNGNNGGTFGNLNVGQLFLGTRYNDTATPLYITMDIAMLSIENVAATTQNRTDMAAWVNSVYGI